MLRGREKLQLDILRVSCVSDLLSAIHVLRDYP